MPGTVGSKTDLVSVQ